MTICVSDIQIRNDSRDIVQFNIWYRENFLTVLNSVTFGNVFKISLYSQLLYIWL